MNIIPQVTKSTPHGERGFDIYSRLLDDRIIMLDGEINDQTSSLVMSQLLYLNSVDKDKDISLYINSPGGSVSAGLGIIDTMNLISNDIITIGTGMSASMGAMILLSGTKGKRCVLPHSEVMIHQPLGGAKGQATDVLLTAKHLERVRKTLYGMIADATGKTYDEVADACERDNYLDANEALAFGLVDKIIGK